MDSKTFNLGRLGLVVCFLIQALEFGTMQVVSAEEDYANKLGEKYFEELKLKPLLLDGQQKRVLADFRFTFRKEDLPGKDSEFIAFDSFPRTVFENVLSTGVEEVKLSLTQGQWNYKEWGPAVDATPSGAQLYAWYSENNEKVNQNQLKWKRLCSNLAGMFCASLNFIDKNSLTTHPCTTFLPFSDYITYNPQMCLENNLNSLREDHSILNSFLNLSSTNNNHYSSISGDNTMYYSTLPREMVCTENLTPFLKLLPCRRHNGLSKLIQPKQIFGAEFTSIILHMVTYRGASDKKSVELSISVSTVLEWSNPTVDNMLSISDLFDTKLNLNMNKEAGQYDEQAYGIYGSMPYCSVADVSKIYFEVPHASVDGIEFQPDPTFIDTAYSNTHAMVTFDVLKLSQQQAMTHTDVSVDLSNYLRDPKSNTQAKRFGKVPISLHRHLTGYGQYMMGIHSQIINDSNSTIRISYMENLPWAVRVSSNSLKIKCVDTSATKQQYGYSNSGPALKSKYNDVLNHSRITPSLDRQRPFTMELVLDLPPNTVTSISFQIKMAFLKIDEHPPDANRGLDIGSAIVAILSKLPFGYTTNKGIYWSPSLYQQNSVESRSLPLSIFSRNVIVPQPTPDFSMPFNVITVSSTVLIILFGFLTVNVFKDYSIVDSRNQNLSILAKIKQKLTSKLGFILT